MTEAETYTKIKAWLEKSKQTRPILLKRRYLARAAGALVALDEALAKREVKDEDQKSGRIIQLVETH